MHRLLFVLLAAGEVLTNSTDETVLGSAEIPANSLAKNKVYKARGSVRAPSTNATDTLQVRVRIGDETLTGTVVADSGAVDAADGNVVIFDVDLVPRDNPGADVDIVARGLITAPGAAGTATARAAHAILEGEDTTADLLVEVTGQWSVANAANQAQLESLELYEITG